MPISVPCPGCGAKLKAPDAAAGRILNCPGCLTPVQMPLAAAPAPRNPAAPPTALRSGPPDAQKKTAHVQPPRPIEEPIPTLRPLDESIPTLRPFDEIGDDLKLVEDNLDVLEEVPEGDNLDALEEVSEEELESLEEVLPAARARPQGPFAWSSIFRLPIIHVRGRLGSALGNYDLCDPIGRKRLGEAIEVRETALLSAGDLMEAAQSARLEVREGRYGELVAMLRRPADDPLGATLQLVDDKEQVHGKFDRIGWKKLKEEEPIWITAERGRKLQVQLEEDRWRLVFKTEQGEEVGEMIAESAYEGRGVKPRWFSRGASFFLRFRPVLDTRPRDKVLFLAVVLGMEL